MRFREFAGCGTSCHRHCRNGSTGVCPVSGYTIAPAGPADPRNNYVPQAGAVFVVDDAKGAIGMCFPTIGTTRSWSFARPRRSCRNWLKVCRAAASAAVGNEAA